MKRKKYGSDGFYYPRLQTGHSAYFKKKSSAKKFASDVKGKVKKTTHTIRGRGYLVTK